MQALSSSQSLLLIKSLIASSGEPQPPRTGTVHRWGPSHIQALGELLFIQSSFELEHCLSPGLFSISQQSAIAHSPGLLLQRNPTYDISLLQRGQSMSSLGLKDSRWNSLEEFRVSKWLICLIKQQAPHRPKKKRQKKGLASQKHTWPQTVRIFKP